jgi:hypothetical protein
MGDQLVASPLSNDDVVHDRIVMNVVIFLVRVAKDDPKWIGYLCVD